MAKIGTGASATDRAVSREQLMRQVRELLRVLRSQNLEITAAYLYGSYDSGTAGPDSDIDVAVISPDLTGDRLQDRLRLTYVATRINPRFEVIGFRPEQFRDEHPLAWEVKTRGILVQ
ncbi:nucleotidyltransferase domain-containing protein [Litorilinea aerophila]|uniref:Nucleotidyltransferase domain-containing protein n=1 Tax=Litorilinea aerophila TaxID=1204385 RepID=A0A540VG38_9CHLR|nr:nucleotidyltransferase domain-containing protein [Litorilinea aerophila]MCC9076740.1 nucleotidyltransferase domain-containing protein [Litorilinea aerophila]